MSTAYEKSGVNVEAGYEVVERIKSHTKKTERLGMMSALGGFGGCFDLSQYDVKEPVLVSGTDGVGTKLMIAIEADKHDTIGIDCVAMCANDILAQGAEPLFFLDYIATGKTYPEKIEKIVEGVANGCVESNMALIGGETAEMPDMYGQNDYDLAGFAVGLAEKSELIDSSTISEGDVLIGIASSGIHSNGFSLVRQILFKDHDYKLDTVLEDMGGQTLKEILLTPTKLYIKSVLPLIKMKKIKGIAHITGGGFYENIPRMLPENVSASIKKGSWPVLPVFKSLQRLGDISEKDMFSTFNMGIGMVLAVDKEDSQTVLDYINDQGELAYNIGQVDLGETGKVEIKGERK
ncbi:phosphoribosylformylglycinamidine cyclo-ligase [Vagococcus bubulae]|uniref:Phosphoribosylformylglycinamidine cyclo-ligase n=1 Tax=Vagococcus bubulae TaxID=1977868 RepID=A0A429ZIW2_9ENTE|nr:phosphoribosylformylglycinamidine cyclo-ligase [Vagococcus bubulae]RST93628.1 phosphoribosylformylglycinamidine cyclo-ligase [Vagococcus bubulae]